MKILIFWLVYLKHIMSEYKFPKPFSYTENQVFKLNTPKLEDYEEKV